jgi:hypothetical protein
VSAGELTVKLSLTSGQAALLSKHKARKLRVKVALQFAPKKGSRLKTSTTSPSAKPTLQRELGVVVEATSTRQVAGVNAGHLR